MEGTLTQLQEKMRDTSVSLVETLKDPSVDKMEQLQLQGAQDDVGARTISAGRQPGALAGLDPAELACWLQGGIFK